MDEGTYANLGMKLTPSVFSDKHTVTKGNHVCIVSNLTLVANSRPNNGVESPPHQYLQSHSITEAPTVIEDEAWIGASVMTLLGVRVGHGAIIGAGSVVAKDVEARGVLTRPIQSLAEENQVRLAAKEESRAV